MAREAIDDTWRDGILPRIEEAVAYAGGLFSAPPSARRSSNLATLRRPSTVVHVRVRLPWLCASDDIGDIPKRIKGVYLRAIGRGLRIKWTLHVHLLVAHARSGDVSQA